MSSTQPQTASPAPVVQLERLAMRYGRGNEIFKDVNLTLRPGTMNFLTGPSGAGKSTLLKLIYLKLRPSRGLVTLFGEDTATSDDTQLQHLKRRIGVVLQEFRLIDHLSVFENVALPLRVTGQARSEYREDVLELLDWVGLGHRMHALPPTLSGGEKQRAAIARAVIARPELLIADEPTGNVDPVMGERLMRLFGEMNRLGTTVFIATHDHHLIPKGSNVLALSGGTLIPATTTLKPFSSREAQ